MDEGASHVTRNLRNELREDAVTGNIEWHTKESIDTPLHQAGVQDTFRDTKLIQHWLRDTASLLYQAKHLGIDRFIAMPVMLDANIGGHRQTGLEIELTTPYG
ncbi:Uncharacterised protein [Klebsiella michiganensis]|nr:Uncharacterised protein [Klebsiella michiganensis]